MEQKQKTRPADEVEEQIQEVKGEVDRDHVEAVLIETDEVIGDIDRILDQVDGDVDAYHRAEYKEMLKSWAKNQGEHERRRQQAREEALEMLIEGFLPCGC